MKKLLFGVAFFMGAMFVTSGDLKAEEEGCTPSVVENGAVITVTVCGRKTSFIGAMAGFTCDATATTQCVFFNYSPTTPPNPE